MEHPGDAQRRLLTTLVRRAKDTAWGRDHGFRELLGSSKIPSRIIEAYQRRVPLSVYGDIQSYFERVIDGEPNVLWPGRPTAFAVSGGTRSGGRVVPLSREAMRFLTRNSLLPGLSYLASRRGATAMLRGKILSLPGGIESKSIGGKAAGEVSGLLAQRAPRMLTYWLQALPTRVMLMEDWETKLHNAARMAVSKDIRAIVMVPSWAPMFFERVREVLGAPTAANAIKSVWPHFRVFFSGGVALSSYRAVLTSYLGPGVDFIESYSASEGLFAFQDRGDDESMLVNLTGGVFFEFVPLGERDSEKPTRHTIETIAPGIEYALYATNTSGLWSVAVEDVVKFVSTRPPRLRIVGRVGEMLDRFGDATSAEHVRKVLTAADEASGAQCLYHHLTYVTDPDSSIPRHSWLLEFDSHPIDLQSYAGLLDKLMKEFNGRYRTRRDPGAMGSPVVSVVPPGSFAAYLKGARKRFSGQALCRW